MFSHSKELLIPSSPSILSACGGSQWQNVLNSSNCSAAVVKRRFDWSKKEFARITSLVEYKSERTLRLNK